MSIGIQYNTNMGFKIDGVTIPDPATYEYSSQSLDTSAERDTTGLLHRKMVDTKYNVSISWDAMDYEKAQTLLALVRNPKFTLTFPCPEIPIEQGGMYTGDYYVGDRKVSFIKASDEMYKWMVSISFDMIEY